MNKHTMKFNQKITAKDVKGMNYSKILDKIISKSMNTILKMMMKFKP